MMKDLSAGEYPLRKIFSSDYEFTIPEYQRPYAWGKEQALQLLDDLEGALARDTDEPYFLGSIVLVKAGSDPDAQVIDGQQRLTTLSILFAVLRDLTENSKLAGELANVVVEPGEILAGTQAKPRLSLRKRDKQFFADHVQNESATKSLVGLDDAYLKTDAQKAIRDNTVALRDRIALWSDDKRQRLATMLGIRTLLVVVSTPDLNSAHRIFSVMNARGLDLTPSDIFKSKVIGDVGDVSEHEVSEYADKWEQEEVDLGRDSFADLFGHVRMIFQKERATKVLLQEFDEQVLSKYLPGKGREFVDEVLIPYSDAYEHLLAQNYPDDVNWSPVNSWLRRLMQVDNDNWRAPALWALKEHGNDPAYLAEFLRKLERLAASMLLRRVYATPRGSRYGELLKQLEKGDGLASGAFDLTAEEVGETRDRLSGRLYLVAPVRKYVLLRLDDLLAKVPGVSYQHKMITVEHVLPQNPKDNSLWKQEFTDGERLYWTHRLGNLVLLNRAKNSQAQNYDFAKKKAKYFTSANGSAVFALTTQVITEDEWTPAVIEKRQKDLVALLSKEWELT
ncbi:DUF262 domain-containing HNH endonuclease family protein [Gordonia sp. SMJS1]|uniref:DUF262 domain-containing protein n=1 Tax=Gordonia sp. SMJS1 TaxID=3039400 RepID=UPI002453B9ED|nr:DUF262 domain-containing HNH endonuclease family protein [Gordonia sp. SMJS1]WGJ85501.1 DUF262 domain-containing HNH endonuclease family protein [Gordonia sp. SMJS1]